jgi:hypothetical protein
MVSSLNPALFNLFLDHIDRPAPKNITRASLPEYIANDKLHMHPTTTNKRFATPPIIHPVHSITPSTLHRNQTYSSMIRTIRRFVNVRMIIVFTLEIVGFPTFLKIHRQEIRHGTATPVCWVCEEGLQRTPQIGLHREDSTGRTPQGVELWTTSPGGLHWEDHTFAASFSLFPHTPFPTDFRPILPPTHRMFVWTILEASVL